jgi:hypothetical protein
MGRSKIRMPAISASQTRQYRKDVCTSSAGDHFLRVARDDVESAGFVQALKRFLAIEVDVLMPVVLVR